MCSGLVKGGQKAEREQMQRGERGSLNNALAAQVKREERERKKECAREKIELNSLIPNYYLSIMGGMEPGCFAGED